MKIRNLSRIAVTALFLGVLVSVNVNSVKASPSTELIITYYTGCDTLTQVGQSWHTCEDIEGSSGTLAGDWKYVESTKCDTFDELDTIFEHCGTSWVQRTTLGACQCSH